MKRRKLREEAAERDGKIKKSVSFENAGFSNLYGDFVTRYFQEYFYVPEDSRNEDQ